MPNGGDPIAHETLTAFAPYEKDIEQFVLSHNLRIERWYHDIPVWIIGRDQGVKDIDIVWWSIQLYYGDGEFSLAVTAWLDTYVQKGDKPVHYRKILPKGIVIKRWPRTQKVRIKLHLEKAYKTATAIREEQLTHNAY